MIHCSTHDEIHALALANPCIECFDHAVHGLWRLWTPNCDAAPPARTLRSLAQHNMFAVPT
jgi:hypothetical protein